MSFPISEVVILCWESPATADRSAHKICVFLGVEAKFVIANAAALCEGASIQTLMPKCQCLVVHAETLAKAASTMPAGVSGLRTLLDGVAEHVFAYGFQPGEEHAALLQVLSSGELVGVQPVAAAGGNFQVADNHREWCQQFSGVRVVGVEQSRDSLFVEGTVAPGRATTLIAVGEKPFFTYTSHGGSKIFFSASAELADLDEKIRRRTRLLLWFSRIVPLMMFLRGALGNRLWRNEDPRACFIIDDPLLKEKYGFLNYGRLVESTRRSGYAASIAFIPWNYRRSSDEVAALFSQGSSLYLCIHGCDHTRAEFATEPQALPHKAQLALERMRDHHKLSGIPFDDVMVFPQGLFSSEGIAALKGAGYLAAVNGDVYPLTTSENLLRDLLEPAVTQFSDFPLFGRRYPRDLAEFAFDLFLGKPALVVEHHGFFRNGYEAIETFVDRLNCLEPRLRWANLATICSRACLTRKAADGETFVRFYTTRFHLANTGPHPQSYVLLRRHLPDRPRPRVKVDGREWECNQEEGFLKIRIFLEAGQSSEITIGDETVAGAALWRGTAVYDAGVRLRRMLCEFRDNHVDTNRFLSGLVSSARGLRRRWSPRQQLGGSPPPESRREAPASLKNDAGQIA